MLGTLVEIGAAEIAGASLQATADAVDAAFARIAALQDRLSRFVAASDIGRFNRAPACACIDVGADARTVLAAAAELRDASEDAFDITLGSGPRGMAARRARPAQARRRGALDLGGIAKGHAVDCAVASLESRGVDAGWVNAGGDLRAFGELALPIELRDEASGGVRRFATLEDGAFATSRREGPDGASRHASVAAERCLWADALTKVVVATGNASHPLLERFGARGWLHSSPIGSA
jgi:thiamine biosynthesis lipoprotein